MTQIHNKNILKDITELRKELKKELIFHDVIFYLFVENHNTNKKTYNFLKRICEGQRITKI